MTIPTSPGCLTALLQNLPRANVVGPRLLREIIEWPAPLLPNGLTAMMIVPARLARATTNALNAGDRVMGNRPFRLPCHCGGEDADLQRSPGWWQAARKRRLHLDQRRIRFMPQDSARVAALPTGELSVIENPPPPDAPRLGVAQVVRWPGSGAPRAQSRHCRTAAAWPAHRRRHGPGDGAGADARPRIRSGTIRP